MNRIPRSVIAGAVAFVVIFALTRGRATPYNNYVLLADAFLHGHVWINWPGGYIDALPWSDGRYYIIEAPAPAILLMPLVAIFGTAANQTWLGVVLGAVAIGAAWALGERFGLSWRTNAWICTFLLAGTDLLWCAIFGDVWFLAHVSSVCFTMLALAELAGKRRGWLVALWAVLAVESRFTLVLALPAYAYLLATDSDSDTNRSRRAALLSFGAVLVPAFALWVGYNEARWHLLYDIGYTAWYHQDQVGMPTGSPFRLMYVPYQLWSFFVQTPTQLQGFPGMKPEFSGVALTWTSPALILALFARGPLRWVLALWVLAILAFVPNLMYYVNGFAQFGMRHALDFEPFLVALMMLAARERLALWSRALIMYSIAAGLWGCWYWMTFVKA